MRGSKKLQALEANPPQPPKHGVINTAFEFEDDDSGFLTTRQKEPGSLVGRVEESKLPTPELAKIFGKYLFQLFHYFFSHELAFSLTSHIFIFF